MTRVFLAAGVAALAIAAPASAGPHGGHSGNKAAAQHGGGGGGHQARAQQHGGGGHQARPQQHRSGDGRQARAAHVQRGGGHAMRAASAQHRGGGHAQRAAKPRPTHGRTAHSQVQQHGHANVQHGHAQRQAQRTVHARPHGQKAQRQQVQVNRGQARMANRQQVKVNHQQAGNRMAAREQIRANRTKVEHRIAQRQQVRANGQVKAQNRQQVRLNRLVRAQNQMALRDNRRIDRLDRVRAFAPTDFRVRDARVIPIGEATRFIGAPLTRVNDVYALSALPRNVQYLYPDTPAYYYRYGSGYLYQVDRSSNLIASLLPLLAGGFLAGQYLPSAYMSSYAPNYYGFNNFYPSSYGYNSFYPNSPNICNRYNYGVVYQVDCASGMVENVIPLYAGGYGVGQLLPSSYGYYNVPTQYRSMYYNTSDYGYWYAPGAIYQYDPASSLITSVAALLSPGFSVGQPLPLGYNTYNVPYAYRARYYDTPTDWYRYNNGYIYRVDPSTQLVAAVVASVLT